MATFCTFEFAVPAPFPNRHEKPTGMVFIVTLYADPGVNEAAKVNVVAPASILSVALPLASMSLPTVRPLIVPPMVYRASQLRAMFVTGAVSMVPEPLVTVQNCPGDCVKTVTAYGLPICILDGNVKVPSAVIV